jgi:hypothetical protein
MQAVEKAIKKRAVPGAPKKKKRKRDGDEGDDDDEGGIDINPPDDDSIENAAELPALSSMI